MVSRRQNPIKSGRVVDSLTSSRRLDEKVLRSVPEPQSKMVDRVVLVEGSIISSTVVIMSL